MFSKTASQEVNCKHILHEYENSVKNGETERLAGYRAANPDLVTQFDEIDGRVTATI